MKKLHSYFWLIIILFSCSNEPLFTEENQGISTRAMYLPWISGPENTTVGQECEYTIDGAPISYTTTWILPTTASVVSKSSSKIKLKFNSVGQDYLQADVRNGSVSYPTARLKITTKAKPEPIDDMEIIGPDIITVGMSKVVYKLSSSVPPTSFNWSLENNDMFSISSPLADKSVSIQRKGYGEGNIYLRLNYNYKDNVPHYIVKRIKVNKPKEVVEEHEIEFGTSVRQPHYLRFLARITVSSLKQANVELELLKSGYSRDREKYLKYELKNLIYNNDKVNFDIIVQYTDRNRVTLEYEITTDMQSLEYTIPAPIE